MNAILLRQAKAAQASLLTTTLAGMEKMLREQLEEQARTLPRSARATEAQQFLDTRTSVSVVLQMLAR